MSSEAAAARTTGSGNDDSQLYPLPLAYHEDIVNHAALFWQTLRRFHFLMRTKFMIPVIGGRELDLHTLYVMVTMRSGYKKVVEEKKWREVSTVFNFSATTTSASYALKKHYFNLLYHYEQVHFFKVRGPMSNPPADAFSGSSSLGNPDLAFVDYSPNPASNSPGSNDEANGCRRGEGTIDGKFDYGYLVSVKLGSEVLQGMLFHPEETVPSPSSVPQDVGATVAFNAKACHSGGRRIRRRWDPNHPKLNRSGYNFFFAEKHPELKKNYPDREKEFAKIIGQSWSSLGPDERMVYQDMALMDKERYRREMMEYNGRMKLRQPEEVERRQ